MNVATRQAHVALQDLGIADAGRLDFALGLFAPWGLMGPVGPEGTGQTSRRDSFCSGARVRMVAPQLSGSVI